MMIFSLMFNSFVLLNCHGANLRISSIAHTLPTDPLLSRQQSSKQFNTSAPLLHHTGENCPERNLWGRQPTQSSESGLLHPKWNCASSQLAHCIPLGNIRAGECSYQPRVVCRSRGSCAYPFFRPTVFTSQLWEAGICFPRQRIIRQNHLCLV